MNAQSILLLGPESAGRSNLEQRLVRLGGDVMPIVPNRGFVPEFGDVIFVDAREDTTDWDLLLADLAEDPRPLAIVSDAPHPIMRDLAARDGGMLVLTGAENDGGFRVAMSLCAALAGSERPGRPVASRAERAEWASSVSNPAVAI